MTNWSFNHFFFIFNNIELQKKIKDTLRTFQPQILAWINLKAKKALRKALRFWRAARFEEEEGGKRGKKGKKKRGEKEVRKKKEKRRKEGEEEKKIKNRNKNKQWSYIDACASILAMIDFCKAVAFLMLKTLVLRCLS